MWYAIGAVSGGIAGYLVADFVAYKLQEKMIEKDIMDEFDKNLEEYKSNDEEVVLMGVDHGPKSQKGDLAKLAQPYLASEFEPEEPENEWVNEDLPLYEIISEERWTDQDYPDQVTIMFYTDDKTFAGENEEIISGVKDLIGPDDLLRFGEKSNDPDVVYIRNNDIEADFQVIRVHGSYATLVMGMSEEEVKKPKRTTRRKKSEDDES